MPEQSIARNKPFHLKWWFLEWCYKYDYDIFLGSIYDTFGFLRHNKLMSKNHDQLLWMGELLQSWFSFDILENYFSFQQMILSWSKYIWNYHWKTLIDLVFSSCLLCFYIHKCYVLINLCTQINDYIKIADKNHTKRQLWTIILHESF